MAEELSIPLSCLSLKPKAQDRFLETPNEVTEASSLRSTMNLLASNQSKVPADYRNTMANLFEDNMKLLPDGSPQQQAARSGGLTTKRKTYQELKHQMLRRGQSEATGKGQGQRLRQRLRQKQKLRLTLPRDKWLWWCWKGRRPMAVVKGAMAPSSMLRLASGTTRSKSSPGTRPKPWHASQAPRGLLKSSGRL